MAVVEVFLTLFVFFEFHYFIRFVIKCIYLHLTKSWTQVNRGVAEEGTVYGICSTTDLDFMLHMNNARYLREIDFGRVEFLVKNGIYMACRKLGGKMMQSACSIRYRRSITLFQIFRVRSKLLYWDERNFYFEHRMETISDSFVRAIALEKQTLVGVTPDQVLHHLRNEYGATVPDRPVPPEDLLRWIDSNELSSRRLTEQDSTAPDTAAASNGHANGHANGHVIVSSSSNGIIEHLSSGKTNGNCNGASVACSSKLTNGYSAESANGSAGLPGHSAGLLTTETRKDV